MIDYETATRLDVIYDALKDSTERSQISRISTRADHIELAIRAWELHHTERRYASLDRMLND